MIPSVGVHSKASPLESVFLHGSYNNFQRAFHALCPVFAWCHAIHKRCFTPLNPVSHGLMQKIKGAKVSVADSRPFATPSRSLSGEFLAPALPDAAVARVESDFVGRFNG